MLAPLPPGRALLEQFGVELETDLGGRLNYHWRVRRGDTTLVLRRWSTEGAVTLDYEVRLLRRLAQEGWPVAAPVEEPRKWEGALWNLSRFLPGHPPADANSPREQRQRGRLLAQLHATTAQIPGFGQRGTWRRGEQILRDTRLDETFAQHEAQYPDEMHFIRWHLDRARDCLTELNPQERPSLVVHGDFAPWNLLFTEGQLTGVLDFELAHLDHRVSDFSLAWRGKYDEVVHGYNEVSPLEAHEWAMLVPLWWALLLEQLSVSLSRGDGLDEWSLAKLRQRSPLMESSLS